MPSPYTIHILKNGLRVVIEQMPNVRSAAAGFMVRTGARDETPELAGVSHFLEHMMFKGTAKRTWRDITIDFDRMGSTYNAFTSEERTVYYGWVRREDIQNQIALLADMLRSTLPAEEFAMERKVILEEIAMSKDHLEHVMFDFLQEKIFAGHPLEWPILGYHQTVETMARESMQQYFQRRYAPDNMDLVVAGNVEPQDIIEYANQSCGDWKPSRVVSSRTIPSFHGGVDVLKVDRFKQQIIALTFPSVGGLDPMSETAAAATSILGGENSRIFWNIVQTGISPRAGAFQLELADCGATILFGACQPENAERLLEALRSDAKRICDGRVEPHEVERAKNKRRTSLAVESEAPYYRLTQIMDDLEFRGEPRTVEQMLADVDAVSIDSIREFFERYPVTQAGHLVSVGPRNWPNGV